jgi:hypothetical protein
MDYPAGLVARALDVGPQETSRKGKCRASSTPAKRTTVTIEQRHSSGSNQGDQPSGHRRKEIPATCQLEQGLVDVTNLVVSKRGGTIVLDPQVPGSCVISLDEQGATALGNLLSVWLR